MPVRHEPNPGQDLRIHKVQVDLRGVDEDGHSLPKLVRLTHAFNLLQNLNGKPLSQQ